jgi:hypothetical protein
MSESYYIRRKVKAASERGKRMAMRRWELDRKRRNKMALLTAEQFPSHIVRRVVVITNESIVREATIWSFDSAASAKRKIKFAMSAPTELSSVRSPHPL